jgi:cholesterol transport system auxiliary component
MQTLALILGVALLAQLAGCAGSLLQSDTPADETYRLARMEPVAAPAGGQSGAVGTVSTSRPLALSVARPRAAGALDTDRIAVVSDGSRFDYFAGVRWAESAPQMLQQQIVSALASAGQFGGGVFAAPARVPTELLLDVELRRFEAVMAAGPSGAAVVHVQMQASLVDSRRGVRVASFISEAQAPAAENRRGAVIEAFDRATAQVVADVVGRVQAATAALPAQ